MNKLNVVGTWPVDIRVDGRLCRSNLIMVSMALKEGKYAHALQCPVEYWRSSLCALASIIPGTHPNPLVANSQDLLCVRGNNQINLTTLCLCQEIFLERILEREGKI